MHRFDMAFIEPMRRNKPNITYLSNAYDHKSECKLTKDTPHLMIMGELCGVYCEDLEENWPHNDCSALYYGHEVLGSEYITALSTQYYI